MYSTLLDFIKQHLVKSEKDNLFLKGRVQPGYLEKHYPEWLKDIYNETKFLNSINAGLIERLYCLINNITELPKCKCGNMCKYEKQARRYTYFCSITCKYATAALQENCKNFCLENYGVDHVSKVKEYREKAENTWERKYGTRNLGSAKQVQEKRKITNRERHGGDSPMCNPKIVKKVRTTWDLKSEEEKIKIRQKGADAFRERNKDGDISRKISGSWKSKTQEELESIAHKRVVTNFQRYGVSNPMKTSEIKEKLRENYKNKSQEVIAEEHKKQEETCKLKYGVTNYNQRHIKPEILALRKNEEEYKKYLINCHHDQSLTLSEIAENLGIDGTIVGKDFKRYGIETRLFSRSRSEIEVYNYISSILSSEIKARDFSAIKEELDIYVPEKNLAIEFDGLYYHSYSEVPESSDKFKHRRKTLKCKEIGIKLFHIFENEWLDPVKREIWKSILSSKMIDPAVVVYGRDTKVKELGTTEAKVFLLENHLQGFSPATKYYGLYKDTNLVMVVTLKLYKDGLWELTRFCSKKNTKIIGGASKLLSYFEKNVDWNIIYTFADLRYSYGDLYKKLGFDLSDEVGVSYYYTDRKTVFHKRGFQKQYLSKILGDLYDPNKTEFENVLGSGKYRIIYDCGKLKFSKSKIT